MSDLSVLITSLPLPAEEALPVLERYGFRHVDLVGKGQRPDAEREALADSGLIVNCVALGRDLPAGCTLNALDMGLRRAQWKKWKSRSRRRLRSEQASLMLFLARIQNRYRSSPMRVRCWRGTLKAV